MRNEPLDLWPEEPLFCARCGTTIAADDLFCPRCGQKVERRTISPGRGWYIGLLLLAVVLLLCIVGIGALGIYRGLEERERLDRGAVLTDHRWGFAQRTSIPLAWLQSGEAIPRRLDGAEGWYLWRCSHEAQPPPRRRVA